MLVDETLRPWLLEVNASPSLARDTPLDCEVKDRLVAPVLYPTRAPTPARTSTPARTTDRLVMVA